MHTLDELIADAPVFAGLGAADLGLIAGCAQNVGFEAGELLFREGEPADTFYVVRSGRVAIQTRLPTEAAVLDTARAGDIVGWSWLVPPYRWTFDAVATEETSVVSIDGACLRGKCEADPALGYALLQRVVQVMSTRLHSARVRLLDLYGARP